MLFSSRDIYVKNLTFTLYCGDVCGGGEGGGGGAIKTLLFWYRPDLVLTSLSQSHLRRSAMLRLSSYLIAPYR